MLIDNTGSIAVSSGKKVTRNARHIDIRYHHIRDLIQKGLIKVTHVSSNQIAADGFTKALPEPKFKEFRDMISISGQIEPEIDGRDRLEEDKSICSSRTAAERIFHLSAVNGFRTAAELLQNVHFY